MSERSKAWQKKKDLLDEKERTIREELEESSTLLEGKTKKIIIASLVVGGVALLGYLAYRSFSKSKEEESASETHEVKKGKSSTKGGSNFLLNALLSERVINTAVSYIVNKLSSKKENSEED